MGSLDTYLVGLGVATSSQILYALLDPFSIWLAKVAARRLPTEIRNEVLNNIWLPDIEYLNNNVRKLMVAAGCFRAAAEIRGEIPSNGRVHFGQMIDVVDKRQLNRIESEVVLRLGFAHIRNKEEYKFALVLQEKVIAVKMFKSKGEWRYSARWVGGRDQLGDLNLD